MKGLLCSQALLVTMNNDFNSAPKALFDLNHDLYSGVTQNGRYL